MRPLILLMALLLVAGPLPADYDDGLQAYKKADYATAYNEWLAVVMSPADTVHPNVMAETCYALGMLFWVGQGVEQNTTASARWLLKAAELGHAGAQTKLGYLFGLGQGVDQSDFEAFKWTQMAANQGDVDAQYNLGVFYRDGKGVQANSELALKWFREAASSGDPLSADVIRNYETYGWPTELMDSPVDSSIESPLERSGDGLKNSSLPKPELSESLAADAPTIRDESIAPEPVIQSGMGSKIIPVQDEQVEEVAGIVVPANSPSLYGEDWIRARNPEHFTIQIMALRAPANLLGFIEQHQDWSPFGIYMQSWKSQPLYVLLQGDYPDIEQARAAAAKFPIAQEQREELWIRKFVMVQGLLQDQ